MELRPAERGTSRSWRVSYLRPFSGPSFPLPEKTPMQPRPPQPGPTAHPEQFPVPGAVRGLAVVLWLSTTISFTVLLINMATAPMYGVEPGYAFGYSLPHTVLGVLLAVPAVPVTRGISWARTMAKVALIIQIVLQSLMLLGGTAAFWALFLLPPAVTGVVLMHRPPSQWFFTVHGQAADQEYMQQYAAHYPHPQAGQGYYPPPQYPQQGYGQQPPQNGPWNQGPTSSNPWCVGERTDHGTGPAVRAGRSALCSPGGASRVATAHLGVADRSGARPEGLRARAGAWGSALARDRREASIAPAPPARTFVP